MIKYVTGRWVEHLDKVTVRINWLNARGLQTEFSLLRLPRQESIDTWQLVARSVGQQGPQKACTSSQASQSFKITEAPESCALFISNLPPQKLSKWLSISKSIDKRSRAILSEPALVHITKCAPDLEEDDGSLLPKSSFLTK